MSRTRLTLVEAAANTVPVAFSARVATPDSFTFILLLPITQRGYSWLLFVAEEWRDVVVLCLNQVIDTWPSSEAGTATQNSSPKETACRPLKLSAGSILCTIWFLVVIKPVKDGCGTTYKN